MKALLTITSLLVLLLGSVRGQESTVNPPYPSDSRSAPRSRRNSPNGRYEWVVNETSPVSYQLVDKMSRTICFTIKCYFADSDNRTAIRYAPLLGVYWNRDSNIVALDEFNYRRAGYLYFCSVKDGNAKQIEVDIPAPREFDETRLCTDKAWVSSSTFSVRQATKLKGGGYQSNYYIIDFANEDHPTVRIAERFGSAQSGG